MHFRKAQSVRLVIADDHPIFRDGLRRLLEAEPDLKVLGEASDGAEAVKLARQLKPDILLLDLAMPKHPGLEALRELSVPANAAPVRVILLTAAAEKSQIVEALPLVIESEYRRREAAVGRALQLAATMPDHYGEDELDELAATMASLPSAIGCAVRLEREDGGAVPLVIALQPTGDPGDERVVQLALGALGRGLQLGQRDGDRLEVHAQRPARHHRAQRRGRRCEHSPDRREGRTESTDGAGGVGRHR